MKLARGFPIFLFCALVAVACNPFDVFDELIEYERMKDQESFRPYEARMPGVAPGAVPTKDGKLTGEEVFKAAPMGSLRNPLPAGKQTIARGELAYEYFCVQCHGSKFNGDGTVGQSFAPLPTDLKSEYVQQMSDDELFRSISYGMMRHPPMWYTVSAEDRWALIHWIQSLGTRGEGDEVIPSGDYQRSVNAIP
jgi:mono/diheme cytochrome c family protein